MKVKILINNSVYKAYLVRNVKMNSHDFDNCREFLENLIKQEGINESLLNVYSKLIELKSLHDKEIEKAVIEKEIRESESYNDLHAKKHRNDTDYDITRDNNQTSDYREDHHTLRELGIDSLKSIGNRNHKY